MNAAKAARQMELAQKQLQSGNLRPACKALRSLETAYRRDPEYWFLRGRVEDQLTLLVASAKSLARAAEQSGENAEMMARIAVLLAGQRRLKEARPYIDSALQKEPNAPLLLDLLGRCLNAEGRYEEVLELIGPRLEELGNGLYLQYVRAAISLRRTPLLKELQESLATVPASWEIETARSWVAQGLGHHDEALDLALAAKNRVGDLIPPALQAHSSELRARDESRLEAFEKAGEMRKPSLSPQKANLTFILGLPRSGTTLLEERVARNAKTVVLDECHLMRRFNMELLDDCQDGETYMAKVQSLTTSKLDEVRTRYFKATEHLLGHSLDGFHVIDKSPECTAMIPLLTQAFPDARLLVALRDPRDCVLSAMIRFSGPPNSPESFTYRNLDTASEAYATTLRGWQVARERIDSPWLEVRYEEIVRNEDEVLEDVFKFLGLPRSDERTEDRSIEFQQSPSDEARLPVFQTSLERWRRYSNLPAEWDQPLREVAAAFGY